MCAGNMFLSSNCDTCLILLRYCKGVQHSRTENPATKLSVCLNKEKFLDNFLL